MRDAARYPDQGNVNDVWRAVWAVEDAAAELFQRKALATSAAALVTGAVWSGQGAQAYLDAAIAIEASAGATIDAWVRLAEAMTSYASGLASLQAEADAVRLRLGNAEDEQSDYQAQMDSAERSVAGGEFADVGRLSSLSQSVRDAEATVAREWVNLGQIADDRRALDNRVVGMLQDAPGPGAAAWAGLVYRSNGSMRSTDDIVDEVLDRIGTTTGRTALDYDVVAQFLASHSNDSDVMAQFYAELGPEGLATFMATFSTADDLHHAFTAGHTSAAGLSELLATGLATASTTWDAATAQGWGVDLVDTMDGYARSLIVPFLVDAAGLNPQVAVGAFGRMEHLRTSDPDRFALITRQELPPFDLDGYTRADLDADIRASLGGDVRSLEGAIFGQLSRVPGQAYELLGEEDTAGYWFGEHDWSSDGFAGPASVLDAIVNDPDAVAGRTKVPVSELWLDTVAFASLAAERLGGNQNLQVGTMSGQAQLDVAKAMATFAGEITGDLGGDFKDDDFNGRTAKVLIDGQLVDVPALTTQRGNLSRLLGIMGTDPTALATFGTASATYARQVMEYLTSPSHPDDATAKTLVEGIGKAYALTYASYGAEARHHAELVDEQTRKGLDRTMRVIGAIPGFGTGKALVEWVLAVVAGNVDLLVEATLLSPEELAQIRDGAADSGKVALDIALGQSLGDRWDQIDPPYDTTTLGTLVGTATEGYDDITSAAGDDSYGIYDVVVIDENGNTDTVHRQDMP